MGRLIAILRIWVEKLAGDSPIKLRIGGLIITIVLLSISAISGWFIEKMALSEKGIIQPIGLLLLLIALASSLATRSLRESVLKVLKSLPNEDLSPELWNARKNLSKIVGRDVQSLNRSEILRAVAETASENSVDGIFAPLFWMLIGAGMWQISTSLPGPLTMAWIFKAGSTIDSMIGYRKGRLRWLGSAGAHLDDGLTWLPCRIVMITLPLISKPLKDLPSITKKAWIEGTKDNSPNSGLSEAIFAHCADIKMGGNNLYQGMLITKPNLAVHAPEANIESINRLLNLSLRLEFTWLISILLITSWLP